MISFAEAINPPADIKSKILDQYEAAQVSCRGYSYRGSSTYSYKVGPNFEIDSDDVIQHIVNNAGGKEVTVLDIGTGDEHFIANAEKNWPGVKCYGLSAFDMRNDTTKFQQNYIIGNANCLSEVNALRELQFDCIFSRTTFMHLVDPIGAIIQAYAKLKPDGWLIIDLIPLYSVLLHPLNDLLTSWHTAITLILRLRAAGYNVTAFPRGDGFGGFLIQKTHAQLLFPLTYNNLISIPSRSSETVKYIAGYQPNFSLSLDTIEQQFQSGQNKLKEQTKPNPVIDWHLRSSSKFKHLFIGPKISTIDMIYTLLLYTNYRFQNTTTASLFQFCRLYINDSAIGDILRGNTNFRILDIVLKAASPSSRPLITDVDTMLHLAALLDIIDMALFDAARIPFPDRTSPSILDAWKPSLLNCFRKNIQPHCDTIKRRLSF